jgi:hypothetical protein
MEFEPPVSLPETSSEMKIIFEIQGKGWYCFEAFLKYSHHFLVSVQPKLVHGFSTETVEEG